MGIFELGAVVMWTPRCSVSKNRTAIQIQTPSRSMDMTDNGNYVNSGSAADFTQIHALWQQNACRAYAFVIIAGDLNTNPRTTSQAEQDRLKPLWDPPPNGGGFINRHNYNNLRTGGGTTIRGANIYDDLL